MSVSGLQQVGSTAMMHQPHQVRSVDAPGDRFALTVPFEGTQAFGRSNRIFLPPLEMVVEDAYVEFQLTGTTIGAGNTPLLAPTATWIGTGGVQLLYKAQSLYTMSEPEAIAAPYVNTENAMQLARRLKMCSDYQTNTDYEVAPTSGVTSFYINLKPIIDKQLGAAGPLNAYAANAWSIDLNLKNFIDILKTASSNAGTASVTINSVRLILIGHREDAANAMRVSEALAKDGVKCIFNQSNHSPQVVPSTGLNHVFVLSDLEGEATDIWLVFRNQTGRVAATTTARNTLNWVTPRFLKSDPNSLLSIGTSSNPTRVYGQPMSLNAIQNIMQGNAYDGSSYVMKFNNAGSAVTRTHTSIIYTALCEAASMGQKFGTYSGSVRLKNDFRLTLNLSAAGMDMSTTTDLDIIVFIRRVLVVTHAGIIMVNEE